MQARGVAAVAETRHHGGSVRGVYKQDRNTQCAAIAGAMERDNGAVARLGKQM